LRLALFLFLATSVAAAQQAAPAKPARTSPWFNAQNIDFVALTPAPPASGSALDRQDMQAVLLAQRTRTSAQIQRAQADDKEEDIFVFASVFGSFGSKFNAAELPVTAALSQHLRDASGVVNSPLKLRFARPRPFVASTLVHPVCEKTASNSFPSGHSMVGTLEALALTQIVPEQSTEIFRRLDQYAHNRVVCGVHYPSDVAASRTLSASLFGLIAASPAFQKELASARAEVRNHMGLTAGSAEPVVARDYLANNTVLIVRHAEKPDDSTGQPGLTEAGRHRAEAYRKYFQPFREDGMKLKISALYAGADSESSIRPRLTLEPLSKASGMALNTAIGTKDPEALRALLRTQPHGETPLICWRHGQIPALLSTLGAAPASLLPGGKWPDEVYDWVVVLQFDAQGRLASQKLVRETLQVH